MSDLISCEKLKKICEQDALVAAIVRQRQAEIEDMMERWRRLCQNVLGPRLARGFKIVPR